MAADLCFARLLLSRTIPDEGSRLSSLLMALVQQRTLLVLEVQLLRLLLLLTVVTNRLECPWAHDGPMLSPCLGPHGSMMGPFLGHPWAHDGPLFSHLAERGGQHV
jgi:hypothetical protein